MGQMPRAVATAGGVIRQPVPHTQLNQHRLYRFHQWQANLRILDVTEIKTVPYVPLPHPFIERLIGTIRRECLDHSVFWTATDLALKLSAFKSYYNGYRCHQALKGRTPTETPQSKGADIQSPRWQKHCRGLYHTPIAA